MGGVTMVCASSAAVMACTAANGAHVAMDTTNLACVPVGGIRVAHGRESKGGDDREVAGLRRWRDRAPLSMACKQHWPCHLQQPRKPLQDHTYDLCDLMLPKHIGLRSKSKHW